MIQESIIQISIIYASIIQESIIQDPIILRSHDSSIYYPNFQSFCWHDLIGIKISSIWLQ